LELAELFGFCAEVKDADKSNINPMMDIKVSTFFLVISFILFFFFSRFLSFFL